MVQYDKKIMNQLLDTYEKSLLFTGENKVNINIQFAFNRKIFLHILMKVRRNTKSSMWQ